MKLRYLLCISLMVFLISIPFACAEEFDVAGHSFEVPKGYSVNVTSDNSTTLVRDNNTNYSLFIIAGELQDTELAKSSRQNAGFKFLSDENFTAENNITVNRQNFLKNESYFMFYSFDVDETSFLMGYIMPMDDDSVDGEDNPAIKVIESVDS